MKIQWKFELFNSTRILKVVYTALRELNLQEEISQF